MHDGSHSSSTPNESREFLQRRVAQVGLLGACPLLAFAVFRMLRSTVEPKVLSGPSFWLHVAAGLSLLVIWLLCRSGERSVRFIRWTETIGMLCCGALSVAMGYHIPLFLQPHKVVLLMLTFGLISRAVFVPSSGKRTFLLTASVAIMAVIGAYATWLKLEPSFLHALPGELKGQVGIRVVAVAMTVDALAWWACSVFLATSVSWVVYGLRRQVRAVTRLGQYVLEAKIGEGTMGLVYRARHGMLRRPTAVKLLPAEKMGAQSLESFEREVRLTARLTHPNTVTVFDYGSTPEGLFYYAMELLDGATLRDVVELDGAQPAARVRRIMADCAGALAEAHEVGLIHRDVKPANIVLSKQGGRLDVAKLLDFGLVREQGSYEGEVRTRRPRLVGTPLYMSPEAFTDSHLIDARSDLYGLGAVGHYLLTGRNLFESCDTLEEVRASVLHEEPASPSERLGQVVHAELEALIMACLAKDPAQRPESASELEARLLELKGLGEWQANDWWQQFGSAVKARHSAKPLADTEATVILHPSVPPGPESARRAVRRNPLRIGARRSALH